MSSVHSPGIEDPCGPPIPISSDRFEGTWRTEFDGSPQGIAHSEPDQGATHARLHGFSSRRSKTAESVSEVGPNSEAVDLMRPECLICDFWECTVICETRTADTASSESGAYPMSAENRRNLEEKRPKVSRAWGPFVEKLAASLEALEEDDYLVLTSKLSGQNIYVQFMCQGSFGLRAEAVSNHYLERKYRLSDKAQKQLLKLGWSVPTHSGREEKGSDQRDPDGGPNYFADWERPVPFAKVAQMAAESLRDVYRISHPGALMYKAASTNGTQIRLPQLGLRLETVPPSPKLPHIEVETNLDANALRAEIVELFEKEFGKHSVAIDDDDDVALRWQNLALFVRIVDDPRMIRLFSPLLAGVPENESQFREVNGRNSRLRAGKLMLANQLLMFSLEMFAEPFLPDVLLRTSVFALAAADELTKELRPVLGGRPVFGRSEDGTLSPRWRNNGNVKSPS